MHCEPLSKCNHHPISSAKCNQDNAVSCRYLDNPLEDVTPLLQILLVCCRMCTFKSCRFAPRTLLWRALGMSIKTRVSCVLSWYIRTGGLFLIDACASPGYGNSTSTSSSAQNLDLETGLWWCRWERRVEFAPLATTTRLG